MTSVWKRLQRVGKKASKFQFTALYQSLTVECVRGGKWQPNKLVVVWTRRKRRKATKPTPWQPGISNPFRGIIVWPEPEPVDITVTLYKDPKPDSEFEDKEWTFVIEDESQTGRRKPIATGVINMVDYVSVESRAFEITLTMKVASRKLVSASLELTLSCVLIKEGMATDDDMISIGSMMSLNHDNYNLDDDDDMEVAPSPRLKHKRNLSSGNVKFPPAVRLQDLSDGKTQSPTASPVLSKKQRSRIRSKSALGENVKKIVSDAQKEDAAKRLSTGSDVSSEVSDSGQEVSKDKSRMESELIKWARSRTQGYKGVKVKNMTTSWRDGLAFCAILHSFHPDEIDFSSLGPLNIKDNCKLAFSAFEKLGIPRLLDPTQMMFSPVPDKLSVMTYVFQIKTYFSRPPALPPSPLSFKHPAPRSRPAPPPPKLVVPSREELEGLGDGTIDIGDSGKRKGKREEAYNPFLDDTEDTEMETTPEKSTPPSAIMLTAAIEGRRDEKDLATGSLSANSEGKALVQEGTSDVSVKNAMKLPPKPPRIYQTSDGSGVSTKAKSAEIVDKKEKLESKGYNPFDEDQTEDVVLNKKTSPSKIRRPPEGYNPFDDDNAEGDPQEQIASSKETEIGYNPFDDEGEGNDVTQTKKVAEQNAGKNATRKKKMSYPHAFNPFEDNDDLKSSELDESLQKIQTKGSKGDEDASSKGYNPFDDDDESVNNDVSQVESSTRKSNLGNKDIDRRVAQTGRASPSGLAKQPVANKKRQAPPPPAARPSDDPWTARLPEEVVARRRRTPRPGTPGGSDQASPQTSPARRVPKRTAPTPPRRPPLIPTFDDWKSDRAVTGGNERPAATPSTESSLSKATSSGKVDETGKATGIATDGSGSRSPKASSGEGANQPDIKLLARQVLMDARKKAGASGALPKERVAEITKTSKGPGASEGGARGNDKADDQEALKKKENLRLRKEELQRRRKATEKAQKMVQNAVERGKAQKLSSSSEQLTAEKQAQEGSETDASSDQKAVKNKNLQHRPLKLKDKENESSKRRPSTEKDAKSPPDKPGFKESDELQRIRQILNQGKKDKKPSTSENQEQENGIVKGETERKLSDGNSSKNTAVNGLSDSPTPTPPTRTKMREPNAGLHAYVESRKMNFEVFEMPPVRTQSNEHEDDEGGKGTSSDGVEKDDGQAETHEETYSEIDDQESLDQTAEFQDTSEYVRQELKSLEEQQEALDKVGEKLEFELRQAMECKGCEEEQEKLMQDWFLLVNKKNELVRRQAELNLLKNEEDLERSHDMLQRELRALLEMEDWQKTDEQKEREAELIKQLVLVVNKRDQLVQFEDSQLQQAEKDALHVQKVIANARIPRDKNECVLQ